jgi:4-carboxymuconolactone decarboxylase
VARIPFPTPETMTPEQRAVYDKIVSGPRGTLVGPLRAALHRPELADTWQQFGETLRYRTTLPRRLSELAILVTARACNAPLEWHVHALEAAKAGLAEHVIEELRDQREVSHLTDEERCVYEYARELNVRKTVSEGTYRRALDRFGIVGVVELTALIGYYTMVAMTLNAHEIPLPDGATPAF